MHLKSFLHLLQIATILSLYDLVIGDVSILSSASQDQDSVPALRANKLRSFVSENKKNKKSKKGNNDSSFDLYVFSMSYQPEFCYQNRNRSYNGCENPIDFWRGSLTIHGLWPEVRVLSLWSIVLFSFVLAPWLKWHLNSKNLISGYLNENKLEKGRYLAIYMFLWRIWSWNHFQGRKGPIQYLLAQCKSIIIFIKFNLLFFLESWMEKTWYMYRIESTWIL